MKKFTQFMMMAGVIFVMSATANAWNITVNNNTDHGVIVVGFGEHLFWRQVDCEKSVYPRSVGVCNMPDVICPVKVAVSIGGQKDEIIDNKVAHCGNTEVNVDKDGAGHKACWMNQCVPVQYVAPK